MPAIFEVNGDNTKIIFEIEKDTDIIQSIIGDSAEYLWSHYKPEDELFEDATNQDKLDVTFEHIKRVLIGAANTNKSVKAQTAARETEAENEYAI